MKKLEENNIKYSFINLTDNLPSSLKNEFDNIGAYLLIIKDGVNKFLNDSNGMHNAYLEQKNLPFDKKSKNEGESKE